MSLNRRKFLGTTASLASAHALASALGFIGAAPTSATPGSETLQRGTILDWKAVRKDFPWVDHKLWLSGADYHPIGLHSLRAVELYYAEFVYGPGKGERLTGPQRNAMREMFGQLINAKPEEIAFVSSTTDAENLVIAGMDLKHRKGNVVLDDLHYQASKYMYHMLEKEADVELRIVRHRADPYWRIDPADMESAIDRNTLLVSMALVSNINGYLHDARTTSAVAHAHGAHVYADIIQGAGAIPIDVKALGIDCAGCGTYKWLQGDRGFGFLYVREDLQDTIVKRSRYGARQFSNPSRAQADSRFELLPGAVMYEGSGVVAEAAGAATHAALTYIHQLGIHNIRAHAKSLVDRLQEEMPRLGYPPITPPDNPTPVVSFLAPDYAEMNAKLKKAFGHSVVAPRRWEFTHPGGEPYVIEGVRIAPSVYNNENDINRLLEALA
ncbi:aminotransferase class V-fold PLP-dependent enzyme [soil metagenome]